MKRKLIKRLLSFSIILVFLASIVILLDYSDIFSKPALSIFDDCEDCDPPLLSKSDLSCKGCNLILISIDTLRADHLSVYGYDKKTSPFLDEAKNNAISFSSVISAASLTPNAHMSLFTSLLPSVHGIKGINDVESITRDFVSKVAREKPPSIFDDKFLTLAEVLKNQGYSTAAITGGGYLDPYFGFGQGFDTYQIFGSTFSTKGVYSEIVRYFENKKKKPFFLFIHLFTPHDPYVMDSGEADQYLRGYDIFPSSLDEIASGKIASKVSMTDYDFFGEQFNLSNSKDVDKLVTLYDSKLYASDQFLERLFAYLENEGLTKNSMIVFLSDHGESFLEHGTIDHGNTLYREVLDIPLMIWSPKNKGKVVPDMISLLDIMPTILEGLHLDIPQNLQGNSVFYKRPKSFIVAEIQNQIALINETWKYIDRGGSVELYNLKDDYWEQDNIIEDEPELRKFFKKELLKIKKENRLLRESILNPN